MDQSLSDFLDHFGRTYTWPDDPEIAPPSGPPGLGSVRSRSGVWRRRWAPGTERWEITEWRGASITGLIRRINR